MLTERELREMAARAARPGRRTLSLYLDCDQGEPANRAHGIERRFRRLLHALSARLDGEGAREALAREARPIWALLGRFRPHGRSLVVFSEPSQGLLWAREFRLKLPEALRWEPRPLLRPLIEALDEHERLGIVVADHERARLFASRLGELEEMPGALASDRFRRVKRSGFDHGRSQMRAQHAAEEHERGHLRLVARRLAELTESRRFDRLILGGPERAREMLRGLLPAALRARVVASLPLALEARADEIGAAAEEAAIAAERAGEVRVVDEMLSALENGRSVLGLNPVLEALDGGRARVLVYAEDFAPGGKRCTHCAEPAAPERAACARCGAALERVDDLLDAIVEQAMRSGCRVEQVRGSAAGRLRGWGGVGALLRGR